MRASTFAISKFPILVALALAPLAACSDYTAGDPAVDNDGGGLPTEDGGTPPPVDAGPAPDGSVETDSSVPDVDAGTPPVDAGPPVPGDPGPAPSAPGSCNAVKVTNPSYLGHLSNVQIPGGINYTIYVPAGYKNDKPLATVVGFHGCDDNAQNFGNILAWGESALPTDRITISLGGKDGQCWDANTDGPKADQAVAHASKCWWIHQKKITLAGYSSGGIVAYGYGLKNANRFAGILIENSGVPGNVDAAIAAAPRKIPVAHKHAVDDRNFPIATARTTWAKLRAAGHSVVSIERPAGQGHENAAVDWAPRAGQSTANTLLINSVNWSVP